jgi:fatty-acid desaturase
MSFLDRVLDPPSYGYEHAGVLTVPTHRELLWEFLGRMNIIRSRKNWLPLLGWTLSLSLTIPLVYFLFFHFNFWFFVLGFLYSMVIMGTHGTVWLHRYSTHRAYTFRNSFARFVCRNLVIKIFPEEIYVISHHVHHAMTEKPGDPYNVHGGWLYCFLADANHQMIRRDLSEVEYARVARLMEHTGVRINSYGQYLKWGTLCHPVRTIAHFVLNWTFWYGIFYLMGGNAFAIAIFGMAAVWAVGVRTYNYDGHGGGKDKREEGIDFNRGDLSINQIWPGYVAGEWHNNHHLYPNGARSGFLPYQLDLAWLFIRGYAAIGAITHYRDFKAEFLKLYGESGNRELGSFGVQGINDEDFAALPD